MSILQKCFFTLFLFITVSAFSEPITVSQHDGFDDCEYTFTSAGIEKTAPEDQNGKLIYETNLNVKHALAIGQSDILIFNRDNSIHCFNTITSTLRDIDRPASLPPGTEAALTTEQALELFSSSKPGFGLLNYSILSVYLASLVLMGFYFSKREKGINDFFLAGKRIPWWAAALSIFGTQLSAITFMAIPAKTFSSDWRYFIGNLSVVLIAAPITCMLFVPFYRRLNVATAYEYLEKRFSVVIRLFASAIYVITQLIRIGIVIYLPALALATVTGINVQACILLMGVLCIIYTVLGGIEAVIWTDVLQVVVLFGGALLCLILILWNIGYDIGPSLSHAYTNAKLSLGSLEIDFTKTSLIVVLLSVFSTLVPYVSDQTVVQRYLTTKDEKSARASVWAGTLLCIPASLLFFGLGTALYMFYYRNPSLLDPGMTNDSIFPWFILNELPAGGSGLLIAGVFAAAMSSLDSAMNSGASAIVNDYVIRLGKPKSEHYQLKLARWITVILGIFGSAAAIALSLFDIKSLWDCLSMLFMPFGGVLCGFFILGAFTKRANSTGALAGGVISLITVYLIQFLTPIHFFLYATISISIVFAVGYYVSLATGGNNKDLVNLTMYSMHKQ